LGHARAQVSAKSPTGAALKYIAKYWDGLILFLTDGRIEMDSNGWEYPKFCVLGSAHADLTGHLLNRSGYRIAN
jgi:hypothetical protein